MKPGRLYLQIILVLIILACESDEKVTPRSYPRVKTVAATEINSEGATFSGEITFSPGTISRHGFLWSHMNNLGIGIGATEFIDLGAIEGLGSFNTRAERSLAEGKTYFMCAFAQMGDRVVYGNVVTFKSLGSRAPKISSINPTLGFVGDTICIAGQHFSDAAINVSVTFNEVGGTVVESTDSLVKVRVPLELATESSTVELTVAGNTAVAPEQFKLLRPEIRSLSPTEVHPYDTLVIHGSNFFPTGLSVSLHSRKLAIIESSSEHITVRVPFVRPTTDKIKLKVTSSNLSTETELTYLKPIIHSLQTKEEITFLDTLRLLGVNIWDSVQITLMGKSVTPLKITPEYIDFVVPLTLTTKSGSLKVSFRRPRIDFETSVSLAPPVIESAEPEVATFVDEVNILGRNFHPEAAKNLVYIAGQRAYPTAAHGHFITVKVPTSIGNCGACNKVEVGVIEQWATSYDVFSLRQPIIESVEPTEIGVSTETITVHGQYFNPSSTSFNWATIDGKVLKPISSTATKLVFAVTPLIPKNTIYLEKQATVKLPNSNEYPIRLKFDFPFRSRAPFPEPHRADALVVVEDGKAYGGLGVDTRTSEIMNDFYEYDPEADEWSPLADFPGPYRSACVIFSLNGNIYVGTGHDITPDTQAMNDLWRYDISMDYWEQIADFPGTARFDAIAFSAGDKAFLGGGVSESGLLQDLWSFDGANWTQLSDIPVPVVRYWRFMGHQDGSAYLLAEEKLYRIDLSNNQWHHVTNVPSSPFQLKSLTFMGGLIGEQIHLWIYRPPFSVNGQPLPNHLLMEYDLQTASWTSITRPITLSTPIGFIVDNKLYATLGVLRSNTSSTQNLITWEYDPSKR